MEIKLETSWKATAINELTKELEMAKWNKLEEHLKKKGLNLIKSSPLLIMIWRPIVNKEIVISIFKS